MVAQSYNAVLLSQTLFFFMCVCVCVCVRTCVCVLLPYLTASLAGSSVCIPVAVIPGLLP